MYENVSLYIVYELSLFFVKRANIRLINDVIYI